jgi:hypothetical protein
MSLLYFYLLGLDLFNLGGCHDKKSEKRGERPELEALTPAPTSAIQEITIASNNNEIKEKENDNHLKTKKREVYSEPKMGID